MKKPEEVWLHSTIKSWLECDFGTKKLVWLKRNGVSGIEFLPKKLRQKDSYECSQMINRIWRVTIEEIKWAND